VTTADESLDGDQGIAERFAREAASGAAQDRVVEIHLDAGTRVVVACVVETVVDDNGVNALAAPDVVVV
jgi:hypothetical protein